MHTCILVQYRQTCGHFAAVRTSGVATYGPIRAKTQVNCLGVYRYLVWYSGWRVAINSECAYEPEPVWVHVTSIKT